MLFELAFQSGNQFAGLLVDGALAVKMIVVFSDGEHAFARNVAASKHVFKKWNYVFSRFGTAEGDNQDGIVGYWCRGAQFSAFVVAVHRTLTTGYTEVHMGKPETLCVQRAAILIFAKRKDSGAPGEIRTPDLLLRRQPLYPAELRARGEYSLHGRAKEQQRRRERMRWEAELVGLTSDRVDRRLDRRLCRRGRGQNHHRRHRRAPFSDVLH